MGSALAIVIRAIKSADRRLKVIRGKGRWFLLDWKLCESFLL